MQDFIIIITRFSCQAVPRGKVRLQLVCNKGCQNTTPCWTRQIQARPNQPWARCSVFIPPPASRGHATFITCQLQCQASLSSKSTISDLEWCELAAKRLLDCGAGVDGAPVLWVYVSDGHYQLAVPRQEVALMRPSPEATPPGGSGSVGEYFFLLPTGGVSFQVKRGTHAKHLL